MTALDQPCVIASVAGSVAPSEPSPLVDDELLLQATVSATASAIRSSQTRWSRCRAMECSRSEGVFEAYGPVPPLSMRLSALGLEPEATDQPCPCVTEPGRPPEPTPPARKRLTQDCAECTRASQHSQFGMHDP